MPAENDHAAKYRNDPRSTEELLHLTLTLDAERDDDAYWYPMAALQHRLPKIWDKVVNLINSPDVKSRDTAATILGQGWVGKKFASERCVELLLQMLAQERSTPILAAVIFALGQLSDPRAVQPLVQLHSHADAHIRYSVVCSLCGFEASEAVAALIERSSDEDREVRNWATFGLGSMIDTDTLAIRKALSARLQEADDEIRGEALVGLARRGDIRSASALLNELNAGDVEMLKHWILIDEAAEAVVEHALISGTMEWLPVLAKLHALDIGEQDQVQRAIQQCSPQQL